MPQACAAFGCSNRRNVKNRQRGITFHKFPKNPGLRKAWAIAVRRKDFEPTNATVLCSCHFKAEDFDRTGQTVRVKECVIPSVFTSFPDHLNKVPNKARSTRTSTQAGETSDDPVSESPEPQNSSTSINCHSMVGCAAFGCTNRSKKGVRMYGFPKDMDRSKKWLAMVSRSNLTIKRDYNNRKLCQAHFEEDQFIATKKGQMKLRADAMPTIFVYRLRTKRRKAPSLRILPAMVTSMASDNTYCGQQTTNFGEASEDFDSTDFVPSVFSYSTQSSKGDAKHERYERKRRRDETPHRRPDNGHQSTEVVDEAASESTRTSLSPNDCGMEPGAGPCTEAKVPKALHDDLKQKYSQLSTECDSLRVDINKLKAKNEQLNTTLRNTQFSFSFIKCKAAQVLFFTGLTSVIFEWLLQTVKDSVEVVRSSLTLEDHLLAILMKLRLGLSNKDIAFRLNVTECDISKIMRSWLPVMSQVLKPLIKWPSRHAILRNMPKCFKAKYTRCRCIIDCTEIFINRPTNLTARAQTYLNYKSHNTVKYLVGMSPAGAITFLSAGWGGRVSDKQLTAESGFYDLLEVNDEMLADRGFTIRDELAVRGATLRIPHFTKGKKQLSAQEVSNERIHIERVIGRWKNFKILTTVIPFTQVDLLNDMVIVCAALTNLCKCIVSRK
ncbi:uncharacterized protein LOC130121000 [Lampris incognitus]|uniref:uncharacterized protein LOC130121000 n=1 Tax=Lampris incognitus TaxID=2546036 RepID=UPI0024B4C886|nr:uncharacterized protein LOC130121000 [Lampris incognitus]